MPFDENTEQQGHWAPWIQTNSSQKIKRKVKDLALPTNFDRQIAQLNFVFSQSFRKPVDPNRFDQLCEIGILSKK